MPTTHEVYFAVSGNPLGSLGAPTSEFTWTPSAFEYAITYQWRVDATNEFGTTTGDVWSFTTITFDPPIGSWRLIPGGSGSGPTASPPGVEGVDWEWTGVNNMRTTRKLVAAASDRLWYGNV